MRKIEIEGIKITDGNMTEVCSGVANLRNKPPDLNERYKFKGPLELDFASGIPLINKV